MVGRLLMPTTATTGCSPPSSATQMGSRPNQSNYSRTWIMREVEDSLRRLATDYVDILYLHRDFTGANLEETGARHGRPDPRRQDPLLRPCRTSVAGASPRSPACATAWACRARWRASRTTTC